MAEGNSRADALVSLADTFQSAVMSHQFFHQNSQALHKEFNIPWAQAKQIIRMSRLSRAFKSTPYSWN